MGHVKPYGNLGGPSSKAKYFLSTDSDQVPWGKARKEPREGSEKNLKPCAYKPWKAYESNQADRVPFVEWTCDLHYVARLSVKSTEP